MRFLIIEEQLRDSCSHHLQYFRTIQEAARARQIEVVIASNREYEDKTLKGVRPVFNDLSRLSSRDAGNRWQRHKALLWNICVNSLALRRLLLSEGHFDRVLCLTTWWPQLFSLWLTNCMTVGNVPPVILLFVNYPRVGEPVEPALRWVSLFVKLLGSKISIYAETSYAQRSWSAFLDQQVGYLVHPASAGEKEKDGSLHSSHNSSLIRNLSSKKKKRERLSPRHCTSSNIDLSLVSSDRNALVFGFYGFARHEQGVDVLMSALKNLKAKGELRAHFRILWPRAFRMPDGTELDPAAFSNLAPEVKILHNPIGPTEYNRILVETDWLVLPYRKKSYEGRCSQISVEACVTGIPGIYTRGTDLEKVFKGYGAGIGVEEGNAVELAEAIRLAVKDNKVFRRLAINRRKKARENFSGRKFIEQICDGTQC